MKPDGGPAFPLHIPGGSWSVPGVGGGTQMAATLYGMSLRDAFAIAALPACMVPHADAETVARAAYFIADAMIAERSK